MEQGFFRNPAVWRAALVCACIAAAAVIVFDAFTLAATEWHGDLQWSLRAASPYTVRVVSVARGGAAQAAGIRAGDRIDFREYDFAQRSRIAVVPLAERPLHVRIYRGGTTREVSVHPSRAHFAWYGWFDIFGVLWLLSFAGLIAWRRPDLPEARTLSLLLIAIAFSNTFYFSNWNTPWHWLNAVSWVLFAISNASALAILARFAALFGRPPSRLRQALHIATYVAVIFQILASGAIVAGLTALWFDPVAWIFSWWSPYFNHGIGAADFAPQILGLLCVLLAVAATRGPERQRVVWATLSIALFYTSAILVNLLSDVFPNTEYLHDVSLQPIFDIALFVMPIGLMYSVLNRKVLDIGFVLNRATVFGILSLIVVGAFVIAEWALSHLLESLSAAANLTLNLGMALVLGLSLRFLHRRVEYVVDRIFFRTRHENEEALRRFAREASFVTDRRILIDRTVFEIGTRLKANGVFIYMYDGNEGYMPASAAPATAPVGENDPAILALRTWREALDLHGFQTCLPGEYAFPLVARGHLLGVLVCGAKADGDTYAPDERDTLVTLSQAVALALDGLARNGADVQTQILDELRALPSKIKEALRER